MWFDEPAAIKKGSRKRRYMTINDFYKKWHNGAQSVYNTKRKKTNIENIVPDKYYTVPELSKIIDMNMCVIYISIYSNVKMY